MNALKLYLVLFEEGKYRETVVFRDLTSLEFGCKEKINSSTTGIIHIGFMRPKVKLPNFSPTLLGNLIVSAAAKWALPDIYETSELMRESLEINFQGVPSYLVTKGFGVSLELSQYASLIPPKAKEHCNDIRTKTNHTIVSAAKEVLETQGKPLSKEEIFAHIIQAELYYFGAKKPVDVLGIELNRYCSESNYTKSSKTPIFGKTSDERFYLLEHDYLEVSGWLKQLQSVEPRAVSELIAFGIRDDDSFTSKADQLPPQLLKKVEANRFSKLLNTIDPMDPHALLSILPGDILDRNILSIGFSVRVENVLSQQGFEKLSDVAHYKDYQMLKWAAFGRKSINDFCTRVIEIAQLYVKVETEYSDDIDSERHISDEERDQAAISPTSQGAIEKKPLIEHFEDTLFSLGDKERQIIECRTGANGDVYTLQEVADLIGVTRERVRQIQKKYVDKIIRVELWDDLIAIKIGQLLATRQEPLMLEMLELEDSWFKGFIGNYIHLKEIIELFSENMVRVIKINSVHVVTRIKQDQWDEIVVGIRKSLKEKAEEKRWTKADINMLFSSLLSDAGAPELISLLHKEFNDSMQFNGDGEEALLVAFGKSAESAVAAVLEQAEGPLHYSEVAIRATELLGKIVDERRAQQALQSQGAKLFGRGIYGLSRFNPISERVCNNIRLVVAKMMYEGPLNRQWHSSGILTKLKKKFPALPTELTPYILNIILESEESLTYLNRMVWARADSNQTANDRIDMADAYTKYLEEHGGPLKGSELREMLKVIRGVGDIAQIQPNDRMIQLGPDLWGLIDRDLHTSEKENEHALNVLESYLKKSQKGVHLSEVDMVMKTEGVSNYAPPYALLNLAQRDNRFHLAKAMFLGLAEWDGDMRRLNLSQAVKKIVNEMTEPMSLPRIQLMVEEATGLPLENSITGLLINNGAQFDSSNKTWFRSE